MQIYFNHNGLTDFNEETKHFLKMELSSVSFTFAPEINYNAEIIVSYSMTLVNLNLDDFPRLKMIHLLNTGYEELDLSYLKKRNIRLINARATSKVAIAEFVIGQILNMNYNFTLYHDFQDQKIWRRHYTSIELEDSTCLIIGAGAIGQAIAKRLKAFNVKSSCYRRKPGKTPNFANVYTDLDEVKALLPSFDYVIMALPSTPETRKMINYNWFKKMNPNALFINIARGDLIIEDDLSKALSNNLIRGAILDVTTKEPLPIDSPLWEQERVLITPHISFYSDKYLENVITLLISNLQKYFNGRRIPTEIKL